MNSRFSKRIFLTLMVAILVVSASTIFATEGSCLLKIVAANDLARTASIYVDDKLAGTLESGELVVFNMDIGPHVITLDGELIEMYTLEVFFQNAFEAKQLELNAKPGKRAVRIISEPSSAAIRLDNEWLEQTTPWQIILDVGKTYEIELFKELYGGKAQSLYIPNKGEVIILDVEIPEADPPLKPRLTYPIDKSVCPDESVVELVWESLDNPLQYELEFDGKVYTTPFSNARFYNLERGKTYSWRVTALNKYGMRTTSERYSLTVQENRGPEIAFVYPQNDSDDVFAEESILKWEVTDADGDSITCDVYFGDESGSLKIVKSHTTSNEYILKELQRGKTYYWKIVATDNYSEVSESLVYSFATMPNRPPIEPFNIIPEDGRENLPDCLTLEWDCTDPDNDNLTYKVYLGADKDSMKQMGETNKKKFVLNDLTRGKTYYWKIVSTDSYGEVIESLVYSFATMANRPPIEPLNFIPKNGTIDLKEILTLEWECDDPDKDELTYEVYVGADSLHKIGETNKEKLSLNDLTRGTSYYWKIVVFDSFGAKTEGPLNTFTTKANIPPVIDPSSEVLLKETDRDVFAELEWFCEDPDDKLLLYDVYLGVDREPSLIFADCDQTTLVKEDLNFGTTYYWQIVAKDEHDGISKGPIWEFTTNDPPVYIPSDFVPEMMLVEKGTFIIDNSYSGPTEVTLTYDFYLGKYEITFDDYDLFVEEMKRLELDDKGWGRGKRPVVAVGWYSAMQYCNWLSEREGLPVAYYNEHRIHGEPNEGRLLDLNGEFTTDITKVLGYRLPTEAEWEYAAKGGKYSKAYAYSGSNNLDEVAWYSSYFQSNSDNKTHTVGLKLPNELGLYDMHGNVQEWTTDWWSAGDNYIAQVNPCRESKYYDYRDYKIVVGGSYAYFPGSSIVNPGPGAKDVGFRISRTIP